LVLDEVTTHLDSDTILALIVALKAYQGALLVVTHDRFFMRCVVEGENPYMITNQRGVDALDMSSGTDHEEDAEAPRGTVYRLFKGQLKMLEGGMTQYEEIAARASSKLTSR